MFEDVDEKYPIDDFENCADAPESSQPKIGAYFIIIFPLQNQNFLACYQIIDRKLILSFT